jgi:hypothetical protein
MHRAVRAVPIQGLLDKKRRRHLGLARSKAGEGDGSRPLAYQRGEAFVGTRPETRS